MKVLVVDDDIAMLMIISKSLEQFHGFHVETVENIEAAFEKLRTNKFDVILSDYMMDNGDGNTLLERLKGANSLRYIPVIFLTAINDDKILKDIMAKGAKGVILKPFIPKELGGRILDIMNQDGL